MKKRRLCKLVSPCMLNFVNDSIRNQKYVLPNLFLSDMEQNQPRANKNQPNQGIYVIFCFLFYKDKVIKILRRIKHINKTEAIREDSLTSKPEIQ